MKRITADYPYMLGRINSGHLELWMDNEQYVKEFMTLSEKEQERYLESHGKLVLDDYEIKDRGFLSDIRVDEVDE